MAIKKTAQHDNLQDIESALTKTEQFIEDHQQKIIYGIGVIILIVVVYLAFTRFYLRPRDNEAKSQMYMAEQYFEKDSFNLALNGDGNFLGFLDIIDDYSMTKAGKLARYYAGISYLRMGQFDDAIDNLKHFKTKDILLGPVALGALGDAYLEKGQDSKALSLYEDAADFSENELTTPIFLMKAGKLAESLGNSQKALGYYQQIKEKFPETLEGRQVDKYIARVSAAK